MDLLDQYVDRLIEFITTNILIHDHPLGVEDIGRWPAHHIPAPDNRAMRPPVPPGSPGHTLLMRDSSGCFLVVIAIRSSTRIASCSLRAVPGSRTMTEVF
jgi:hypothetical protein